MKNQPDLMVSTENISMAVIEKINKEKPAETGLHRALINYVFFTRYFDTI